MNSVFRLTYCKCSRINHVTFHHQFTAINQHHINLIAIIFFYLSVIILITNSSVSCSEVAALKIDVCIKGVT